VRPIFPCRPHPVANDFANVVPDSDYRHQAPGLEGPLDLLFFSSRKNELDIYDIPIESVTRQYIDALPRHAAAHLDLAANFS